MIKVYIFVTGLVLYQFALTPGGTNYAILASGHFDYPGLSHIGEHTVKVFSGQDAHPVVGLSLPLEVELSVSCPGTGVCDPIKEPQEIPSLGDILLVVPSVQSGCTTFDGGTSCHPRGLTVPGRNGLLAFTGNWSVQALTDCGGAYPSSLGPTVDMDFVRAGRSWELRFADPDNLLKVANTVLFTTVVDSMDDLRISNEQLKVELDPKKISDCSKLPGFKKSNATRCAAVLIRNGSSDRYNGGGDLHFAALYALLSNQIDPSNLWLPIASTKDVCGGGGGTGGLSHCTGGRLPRR
ncbi:MAG TPA: hypothetical protein VIA62_19120 [Thermoanaerobaculia bacterium]|jgi:hypothetical protein|nr:hypothetical protein [Thermoanaerobaculia bacterium]